ncbi:MAG: TonB-dependent receptor [Opitutaceae bacterium]|nr:TonB-dependent receptor [Opitutaceae bacterium]
MHQPYRFLLQLVIAVALLAARPLYAEGLTTSGINGFVTDANDRPIAGVTVVITHEPTGSRATAVTRSNGQFSVSQLRVGGPYTVAIEAKGFVPAAQSQIFIDLDHAAEADFKLAAAREGEVVKMEAVEVTASRDATFNGSKVGNGLDFAGSEVMSTPNVRRDVQDIAQRDSRLALTENTSTGEFQLSVGGQNYRYNSFLIDGVQANDPFGLNGSGFSSWRSPIPLDAIEDLSIDLSPYEVRRAGFTGALLNAVIKSGGNDYHGSAYYIFTNQNLRAENPVTKIKDTFRDRTFGFTFGGPIVKNRLFFFLAYDDFRREAAAPSQQFIPTAAALANIIATAKAYGYDAGALRQDAISYQKTYLLKLDWNIDPENKHRMSFTYRRNDGSAPQYADYQSGTSINVTGATTNYRTSLSNHWYQQPRITDSYTAQLFSSWTPDFRTEVAVAFTRYNGSPVNNGPNFPEVDVRNTPGTDAGSGAAVKGDLYLGSERSRQLNFLYTNTYNGSVVGEYTLDKHTITFGMDAEKDDIDDRFAQYILGSYVINGAVSTSNPNGGWLASSPIISLRQAYLFPGYTLPQAFAAWASSNYGFFVQDRWQINPRLMLLGGIRLDYPYTGNKPLFNQAFFDAFGRRNDVTNSGNYTVGPRLGFNYQVDQAQKLQLRGGLGVFQGKNPAVWLTNAYQTVGALSNSNITPVPTTFTPTTSVQTGVLKQNINITDSGFRQPVFLKGNLALDYKLPWWGLILTGQTDRAWTLQAPYVVHLNLWQPTSGPTTLPDGRNRYTSSPALGTAGPKSNFGDVLLLKDTHGGGSEAYTLRLLRPMKDNWSASAEYTRTHSTEVSPMTSSVAFSNFSGRAIANPDENVASISNYNIRDRFVFALSRRFYFFKQHDAATTAALVYRAQSGHPYSLVYLNDANGDGISSNDLLYVPTPTDTRVAWADATQQTAFFNWLQASGLTKYEGRIMPRNSETNPWQQTLDLHVAQELPVWQNVKLEIFFDFLNLANLFNKKYGIVEGIDFPYVRSVVNSSYSATANSGAGQYTYTFNSNTLGAPLVFTNQSRWQIQAGARIKF